MRTQVDQESPVPNTVLLRDVIDGDPPILFEQQLDQVVGDLGGRENHGRFGNLRGLKSPGQQFSNFFNAYSKSINHAYGRTGSLFENRYRRKEVTADRYFQRLIHYIHCLFVVPSLSHG